MSFLEIYLIGGLATTKPGYKEYVESSSAFVPWLPRKAHSEKE